MHVCRVSYKVSIAKKYENFTVTAGNGGGQLKWLFHLFISSFVQLKRPKGVKTGFSHVQQSGILDMSLIWRGGGHMKEMQKRQEIIIVFYICNTCIS